jgi:hypothetical protein
MLGTLGSYAFDIMRPALEDALKHPLGFRIWRAITKLVQLSKPGNRYRPSLQPWVLGQLKQAESLRAKSAYPGRSLDLELAVAIPPDWTSAQGDPVGAALRARADNASATVRERGAAALGLWQRAMENAELDRRRVRSDLERLIAEFEDPERRPDAYQGMQWAAATLGHVMARNVRVCNDWPQGVDEPWLQHFGEAVRHLREHGIPPQILPATETLFQHAMLQNADAYRRQAVETLLAGGWTGPVVSALAKFLELEDSGAWIRIRALFSTGTVLSNGCWQKDASWRTGISQEILRRPRFTRCMPCCSRLATAMAPLTSREGTSGGSGTASRKYSSALSIASSRSVLLFSR